MAKTLAQKFFIKPNQRVAILNAPDGYRDLLGALPEGVTVSTKPDGSYDLVHLFIRSVAELNQHFKAAEKALKSDGMLWISYPKKTGKIKTDISRDVGWDVVHQAGWEGVMLISIDDTWSAMRYKKA